MKSIKAICSRHAVLKDGEVETIGYLSDRTRYSGAGCIKATQVVFHFGSNHQDQFYFENNKLVYHAFTDSSPDFICAVYSDCAKLAEISPSEFISRVTGVYVFKSLGF